MQLTALLGLVIEGVQYINSFAELGHVKDTISSFAADAYFFTPTPTVYMAF
jgi:hypothetical protein